MDNPLAMNDQIVVITGGTQGIGKGIAEQFLQANAQVVVCGRNNPENPISSGDRHATFYPADVRNPDEVHNLVERIRNQFGRIDVWVNNAGGSPQTETIAASSRFSQAIINLNLLAPLYCCQQAAIVMNSQDQGGSIINISSVSGTRASPGTAAYGAAKAGLLNLTETLAVEWAPKIRVNAIVAGLIATEKAHLHYGDANGQQAAADTVPIGRLGTPQDVANVAVFLASPMASYITGAQILLHGGGQRPAFLSAVQAALATPPTP